MQKLCDLFEDRMSIYLHPDYDWKHRSENEMPYLLKIDCLATEIMKLTRRYKSRKRITKLGKKYLELPVSWQYFNLFINYWNELNWAYPRSIGFGAEMAQDIRNSIRSLLVVSTEWVNVDVFKQEVGDLMAVDQPIIDNPEFQRDVQEAVRKVIEIVELFDLMEVEFESDEDNYRSINRIHLTSLGQKILNY